MFCASQYYIHSLYFDLFNYLICYFYKLHGVTYCIQMLYLDISRLCKVNECIGCKPESIFYYSFNIVIVILLYYYKYRDNLSAEKKLPKYISSLRHISI